MEAKDNNIPLMISVRLFSILSVVDTSVVLSPVVVVPPVPIKVPVLAPINTYNIMSGRAAIFARIKCDNFKLVVPHMYETGPSGNIGVRYNMAMIRNPCSAAAMSMASKMGYLRIHFLTVSRMRYRPNKKQMTAPRALPIILTAVAINTPSCHPYAPL